jgi:hypothetical protein
MSRIVSKGGSIRARVAMSYSSAIRWARDFMSKATPGAPGRRTFTLISGITAGDELHNIKQQRRITSSHEDASHGCTTSCGTEEFGAADKVTMAVIS